MPGGRVSEENPIRQWLLLMQRADNEIDLGEAALLIARTEYPQLEPAAELARLDDLAANVRVSPADPPLMNILALNELLFEKEKFEGNEEEYDDPRNSFLNDVLDRKKGIPITLSLVYSEVSRRRNLPVVGVGFPGHFLVKYLAGASEIFIDPYNRGAVLTLQDCEERLKQHFGAEAQIKPEFLAASTPKQVLARMLNNLKGSYFRRQNFAKVLTMIELSLAIDPGSPHDLRDRGMVYFAMNRYREAMVDFEACLRVSPREDPNVRQVLQAIHRIRALMN
jgi:regulator of sirC expression with transglutaminase-like and TPR domain